MLFKRRILFLFILLVLFIPVAIYGSSNLTARLKGKILIQTESHGEAWYVSPVSGQRFFLGKPKDAFEVMKANGIGITNADLSKIRVADENLGGIDSDNDGLSDMAEESLNTDKDSKDTDNDGYTDKEEIINGYNPNGSGRIALDKTFANKQKGKILLQV